MAIQKRNDELANMMSADLQKRYEASFAWRTACSMFQALPLLRGFWPMSAPGFDLSGNGHTLTYNGNSVYGSGVALGGGLAPWIRFDGTGDYLSHADNAALSITGTESYADVPGLTIGGWFRPEDDTTSVQIMGKFYTVGQYAYALSLNGAAAGDPVRFTISDDGTNFDTVDSTDGYATDTWQFFAGRFDDALTGAELAVWINGTQYTDTTNRNSIKDGTDQFAIGGRGNGTLLYTGCASMCFLCACALHDSVVWAIYQHTRALFGV